MRRAYRFKDNSCRRGDERQSYYSHWASKTENNDDYGDRRKLNRDRSNSQDRSRSGDSCSQFEHQVKNKGDRNLFCSGRRSKSNHKSNFRRRNSRNHSPSCRNKRGWSAK